jgi:hypothetical protein
MFRLRRNRAAANAALLKRELKKIRAATNQEAKHLAAKRRAGAWLAVSVAGAGKKIHRGVKEENWRAAMGAGWCVKESLCKAGTDAALSAIAT